jgi:hypothetical protein
MRIRADSLKLSSASLSAIGLAYMAAMVRVPHLSFGSVLNDLLVLACPVLLLATVVYLPRDLFRRSTRVQGIAALALLVPAVMLLITWIREVVLL